MTTQEQKAVEIVNNANRIVERSIIMTAQEQKAMHIINDAKGHALAGNATEQQIKICVTYIEEFNKIKDEYKAAIAVCKDLGLFEKECPPELETEIEKLEEEYWGLVNKQHDFAVDVKMHGSVRWSGACCDDSVYIYYNADDNDDATIDGNIKESDKYKQIIAPINEFVKKAKTWGDKHFGDEEWLWDNIFD